VQDELSVKRKRYLCSRVHLEKLSRQ